MKIDTNLATLVDSGKQNPVGDLILATFDSPTPISYLAKPILYYPYPNQTFHFNAEYNTTTHKPCWASNPLTFKWRGVTNSSQYELIYGTDKEFRLTADIGEEPVQTIRVFVDGEQIDDDGYVYQTVDFLQDFYDALEALDPIAKYYRKSDFFWKVRGKEGDLVSEWTDVWKFHANLCVYSTNITTVGTPAGTILANTPPYIERIYASKTIIDPEETITITCLANDADIGDRIEWYHWKGTNIVNDEGLDYHVTTVDHISWTAPVTKANYVLQCQVCDEGGATSDWKEITIKVGTIRLWVSYTKDDTEYIAYSDDDGASWTTEEKP